MARFVRRRSGGTPIEAGGKGRRGRWGAARAVRLVTAVLVGLIVLGILLVLLEANRSNEIVDWILDAGGFFVEPFDNVFTLDSRKGNVTVNWGLGALIYAVIGGLIVRLLLR